MSADNNHEEELLNALKDLIDESAKDIKSFAKEELEHMALSMSKSFAEVIPQDCPTAIFSISILEGEELDEARDHFDNEHTIRSPHVKDSKDPDATCARVSPVIDGMPIERVFEFLEDFDTTLMMAGALDIRGLIVFIRQPDGSTFETLSTGASMATVLTTPSGERVVNTFEAETKTDVPSPEDYTEQQYDLIKATHVAVNMPLIIKREYPDLYDTLCDVIKLKVERRKRLAQED